ncbi:MULTISPECIES: helix-turn-helix domain-containing protein [unclassified Beijerinckia]|uniref:helix-turn-helix domain-containing protein n=1 Tax=unclassified Beijerinckia TaxID=2638183 RepID=UPI00089D4153|nr:MULTISPECIES: helix-turn-helix domain-containing protein [unclassified Beijerinckia]MDH7796458.1 hypothetical protein [Beijerinckia sp. GAS462]SEC45954.1 regulatory protein, Fis family [Beijerinckia sp. 28-YEA-48]
MSEVIERLVDEELTRTGGNVSKVARLLGMDYRELKQRQANASSYTFKRPNYPIPDDLFTLGKPGMQKHVIAVKDPGGPWPHRFFHPIKEARRLFDAGTHEMCQGRHKDGWVVLYLIPRKDPVGVRSFFYGVD